MAVDVADRSWGRSYAYVGHAGAMVHEPRNLADRMRPLRRLAGRIESAEVRVFGRSVLSVLFREQVLVLETMGRKSGRRRRTTLAYRELDGDIVVVGGAGGQTRLPDWVANLRASSNVVVTLRRQTVPKIARVLEGDERLAAWSRLVADWPRIARYEERSGYPIPVVRLAPDVVRDDSLLSGSRAGRSAQTAEVAVEVVGDVAQE